MFEDKTYESILENMLTKVPDDVDKREGSIIYDALAPCAFALAEQYFQLENFVDLMFPDTAKGIYLDKCVHGIVERKKATKALRIIESEEVIKIGSVWSAEGISYTVIEELESESGFKYKAECDSCGSQGNIYSGSVTPVKDGSGKAKLTDIILPGTDTEDDESLRARFKETTRRVPTSGNISHYINWAKEVEGVGAAMGKELWQGPGTVKVLVLDCDLNINKKLESRVFEHIEKVRPVGAKVTVTSPKAFGIEVSASVSLDGTKTIKGVEAAFKKKIDEYLKSLAFKSNRVSYAKVGGILIELEGMIDYDDLKLNGSAGNIVLADNETIAVIEKAELKERD